jgi:ribosomal protein S18 acetylase RimI-like enzyme
MPRLAQQVELTRAMCRDPELQATLARFDCGDEPWCPEINEWIRDLSGQVLKAVRNKSDVWLYTTEEQELIGYGVLGSTNWDWPEPGSQPLRVNILTYMGIDLTYRGQPAGQGETSYGKQILGHLILRAKEKSDRSSVLGLYVHPENKRAIGLYRRFGFRPFHRLHHDDVSGIDYVSMALTWEPAENTP